MISSGPQPTTETDFTAQKAPGLAKLLKTFQSHALINEKDDDLYVFY
jgi:hypothetical protein